MSSENVVLLIESGEPASVTVKPEWCEIAFPAEIGESMLRLKNFVPLKRIIDLFQGFDRLEIIDQNTPDHEVEVGRFYLRAVRNDDVVKGYCDQFEDKL